MRLFIAFFLAFLNTFYSALVDNYFIAAKFSAHASLTLADCSVEANNENDNRSDDFSFSFTNGDIAINYSPKRLLLMEKDADDQQKATALVVEPRLVVFIFDL